MKKYAIVLCAAALIISCTNNQGGTGQNGADALTTDSIKYEKEEGRCQAELKVDYPVEGNSNLKSAVAEYLSEELGGTYEGNLNDGKAMVDFYGEETMKSLKDLYAETYKQAEGDAPGFAETITIKKADETDSWVTFTKTFYSYTGGAHGISAAMGTTFRKSDGRRFGYDMLKNTEAPEFRALIKNGLKKYFSQSSEQTETDQQLKELLLTENDIDYLPLPQTQPYLSEDGVVFTYQAYEIAPYAAGLPAFVIPYSDITPYLTVTAKKLMQ